MNKKTTALLVVLLLLITVAGVWIWTTPQVSNTASHPTAGMPRPDPERVAASAPEENREEQARRLSTPSWRPSAVFAQQGVPTPQIPFPRGENANRRYHRPQTSDLAPTLHSRQPTVLAKSPEDGRFHLLADEIDLHTLLARRMVFDASALDAIVAGNTSRLLAPTVGEEVLTLEFKAVKTRSAHTHTLFGHVVGEEQSSDVQIVYHDGVLHGTIARYKSGQELEYRILTDGHLMVREIDQSTMNAPCGNGPETEAGELIDNLAEDGVQIIPQEDGGIEGDTVGWRIIDVAVGYDQAARVADGGYSQIEARIISSVDLMTTAFANSLITDTELMLLGTIEDPVYVFPGAVSGSMSSNDELGDLNNFTNTKLDAVSSFATQLGADLINFVLKQADGSAGVAYRPGRTSIVGRDYMTSTRITFAHELGHSLGCDHSWGDSSQSYNSHYGWRLEPPGLTRVRTIMAYDWSWGAGHRIPYFANPNVSYNGAATGAVNGYNVQGDATADQRYFQGGLGYSGSDPAKFGFNGANPALGANNANTINTGGGGSSYGATFASTRATRAAFAVTSPLAGAQWERGSTQSIFFRGGDMKDLATIQLFKGGVFHSTLATNLNPATDRDFPWTLPVELAFGADYMIRVTLDRNGSVLTADSGIFSVLNVTPRVISQSPAASPPVIGTIPQLALTFNQVMNPATFVINDDIISFTGPGGSNLKPAISNASWTADNTVLTLIFPVQSTPGNYQLVLGSQIQGIDGAFLDQDQDNVPGEAVEDRYTANFGIDSSQSIWSENFDAVSAPALPVDWASTTASGSGVWTVVTNSSHSPSQSAFIPDYTTTTTTYLQSPAVSIPAGTTGMQLTFRHSYSLESTYDGGRLELSVNGGSWFGIDDSGSGASFGSGGYTATIKTNSGTPMAGKNAWTGTSSGYIQTVVNLTDNPKFAGNSLRGRWVLATDSSVGDTGWNLDTIQLTGTVPSASLTVTPSSDLAASGDIGGPFTPGSQQYILENPGSQPLDWTAAKTAAWLDLSATSGTLAPAATTIVTVSINNAANTLLPGAYSDVVTFATTGGAGSNSRNVNLTVTGPGALVVTPAGAFTPSGISGGPFTPSSRQYTLSNPGNTPIDWTAGETSDWVDLSTTSGTLAAGANTTVTASINSAANALAVGAYSEMVSFANTTNGSGNTTRDIALSVSPTPATVTLGNLSQTYNGSPKTVSVTTNPPGLTHEVTYAGSPTAPTNGGTYAVVATITDPNYSGSDAKNLVITKAAQTINFAALVPITDDQPPFALTATATSGLTVSYNSSNTAVATVSGSTVTLVGLGSTTLTASQTGDINFTAATSVPQNLTVVRANPLAAPGGPYKLLVGQSLSLNGSASQPSFGETVTTYEWDLNNDNTFGDVSGATPAAISFATLASTWGMASGPNTIQLKVTDSANKTSIVSTIVELVLALTWDANGTTAGQTNGAGAWLDANRWWDGAANQTWAAGSNATFGGPNTAGAAVTLASPTTANAITFNTFTGTYTLGTAGQALTLNGGINKTATSAAVAILSPITLGAAQTWTHAVGSLTTGSGTNLIDNAGYQLTVDGVGNATFGLINNIATALTGSGALVKSGSGTLALGGTNAGFTGNVTVNGGVLRVNAPGSINGNLNLNGGVYEHYWNDPYTRTLGTGAGQVQITGGASGFSENGATSATFTLNNSAAFELVWGSALFSPTTFVLQADTAQTTSALTFANKIDLNGTTRTIQVGGGTTGAARATLSGVIRNSTGTAGLIKTGSGQLIFSANNTYNGATTVSGGMLDFGAITLSGFGGGSGRNISVAGGSIVRRNALDNAFLNRLVETSDSIAVMTGGSGSNLDFSSSTGANLPNAFLGNWSSNGAKAEYTGVLTGASDAFRLGSASSSGLLGIRSALTGTRGLIVGGNRVELVNAGNTFSGDTVIRTGGRLYLGNNLALQNSALDTGTSGGPNLGTFGLSDGTNSGRIADSVVSASPTLGGLKGGRDLLSVYSSASAGNNATLLASTAVTGFTLNPGAGKSHAYSGGIANFATGTTLTKTGLGTQILAGANTYTGATTVSAGKLFINGSLINTDVALSVNSGATLGGTGTIGRNVTIASGGKLEFDISTNSAGHDRLDISAGRNFTFSGASELTITSAGGAAPGTYTLVTGGNPIAGAAPAIVNLPESWVAGVSISGNSLLLIVTSTVGMQAPYAAWSGGAAFDADTNGDGVDNGMAWLLGAANKNAAASGLLPVAGQNGGILQLTFRCLKTANRGTAVLKVQYTNDLGQADLWTSHEAVVPDADGTVGSIYFDTTADIDPAYINVRAEVPAAAASPGGKLFGRLYSTSN